VKNLTWQNPEQLFVAQELINKVKSKCCGIKDNEEIFCSIIKRLDITEFCSCIMQILAEKLQLSIGFMPLDPMSGKATKMLYKKFNDFNIPIKTT